MCSHNTVLLVYLEHGKVAKKLFEKMPWESIQMEQLVMEQLALQVAFVIQNDSQGTQKIKECLRLLALELVPHVHACMETRDTNTNSP